jgi:hypothetical protein
MRPVPVAAHHTDQVKNICDNLFGVGYANETMIQNFCSGGHGLVVEDGDIVAGFSLFRSFPLEQIKKQLLLDPAWIDENLGPGPVGLRRSTGVRVAYRDQQIGPLLIRESMNLLNDHPVIVSVVWDQGGKHIGPLLERNGMHMALEVPDYWAKDSEERGYDCPVCGLPPCDCKAFIYLKRND